MRLACVCARTRAVLAGALLLAGCSDTISVTFPAEQELQVSAAGVELPASLQEGGQIAEVPCGPMGSCPMTDEANVTLTCEMDVCDPAPKTLAVPAGDVVDFSRLDEDLRELVSRIERIEILEANYRIEENTLSFGLEELEIHWGPMGAVTVNPDEGTRLLGTVPAIDAGQTRSGAIRIDAAGQRALSEYLVDTSPRVRFFVRTRADIDPGDPWPQGRAAGAVEMRIRAEGSAL